MKRRVLFMIVLILSIFMIDKNIVNAKENVYYTTPKGIELTEEEYKFLTTFYWDNYVNIMTEEQYEDFVNSDLLERELKVVSNDEDLFVNNGNMCSPKSTSHSTAYKRIQIGAACSSDCVISLVATWFVDPAVRSYDVIGTFLSGVSLVSQSYGTVSNSTTTYYYDNFKTVNGSNYSGLGNSVLLPSGSYLVVNQIFVTTTGGHIYGSYQHAIQTVSLSTSKNYNFSLSGYGNVFAFYGSAYGKYDGMAGVDIAV